MLYRCIKLKQCSVVHYFLTKNITSLVFSLFFFLQKCHTLSKYLKNKYLAKHLKIYLICFLLFYFIQIDFIKTLIRYIVSQKYLPLA